MGGFHTSHRRWFRTDVISGKVGQDEMNIEVSGRYAYQHRENSDKGPTITLGIPVVQHEDIYSSKPTPKGVSPHSR